MVTVTGLTAARMIEMENRTVIDGEVVGDDLILTTRDGTPINTGSVRGAQGPAGGLYILCTSTTRPPFGPTDEGKPIYETDTEIVRVWTGTRWRIQEKIICTSTTRPTGLTAEDEGVKIYETDTGNEFIWSGSAWIFGPGMPIGFEMTWPGATVPTNMPGTWMFEQGQLLSRTTYDELFGILDTAFNTGGESASEFRLPNMQDRVVVGASGSRPRGQYGGASTHTLVTGEMPQHNHADAGHQHQVSGNPLVVAGTPIGGGGWQVPHDPSSFIAQYQSGPFNSFFGSANIQYAGGNGPHNNMQPYVSKNVMIRVL